jgi:two-component system LytT family response regulator
MPPDLGLINSVPLLAGTQRVTHARGEVLARLNDGQEGLLTRIAVRSLGRIVIVPVQDIVRLDAEDNYVRIWTDRPYLHKETLTRLCARLDPAEFLRVHRSHAVNLRLVRELHPQCHGEFRIVLANGTEITSGRSYRAPIQRAFGLGKAPFE